MSRYNILVVDDDTDFADSLVDVLELEGHAITFVYSAADAIKKTQHICFDYIFIDLKLGDINGIEVAHQIHAQHPKTKIVIMTGYLTNETLKQSLSRGIIEILYKPFRIEQVLELIART